MKQKKLFHPKLLNNSCCLGQGIRIEEQES
jgi:hypothetical protein